MLRAIVSYPSVALNLEENLLIFVTVCALSYNTVSNSGYVASKGRITHE
jgi:hypothetical protein